MLVRWSWPHNVREVERVAAGLLLRGRELPELGPELLDDRFWQASDDSTAVLAPEEPPDREALVDLLRSVQGNVSELARRVGRSTKQVYRWCSRHGVSPDDYR